MSAGSFSLEAPAKINLYLQVLRRRADGYHELRTVMHTLELADRLSFSASDQAGIQLTCLDPNVPTGEDNLVVRAALALAAAAGRKPAVRIRLVKRIPLAAGLGGGSSDAAAALLGLNRLWRMGWSKPKLARIGAGLGSDVPFFLWGGCALGTGRGEKIRPWPSLPGMLIALVNPGFEVPTREVYGQLKLKLTSSPNYINLLRPALVEKNPTKISRKLYNRLEEVTLEMHPALKKIKQDLLDCGASAALMSGSGPTVFGLLPSARVAAEVRSRLGKKYPFVKFTRTSGPRV
jgi:4-diphosphocytidyl-2-C-methyl-D-erythritol kinase